MHGASLTYCVCSVVVCLLSCRRLAPAQAQRVRVSQAAPHPLTPAAACQTACAITRAWHHRSWRARPAARQWAALVAPRLAVRAPSVPRSCLCHLEALT